MKRAHIPNVIWADIRTRIDFIANDSVKAKIETEALRKENSRLRYHARKVFEKDLKEESRLVSGKELKKIKLGLDKMNDTIVSVLGDGGAHKETLFIVI